MKKKILIGVVVVIAAFFGFVIAQPSTYHVERSVQIAAPAEVVRPEISDFNQWGDGARGRNSIPAKRRPSRVNQEPSVTNLTGLATRPAKAA